MNYKTKAFWEKVRSQYKPEYGAGICHSCRTFAYYWSTDKGEDYIKKHGQKFLYQNRLQFDFNIGMSFLFNKVSVTEINVDSIKVREMFIDYMINKTNK